MITKDNIIAISTTVSGNKICDKRRMTIKKCLDKYGIKLLLNEGITKRDKIYRCFINNLTRLVQFKRSGYDYGLICDDDFYPVKNFMNELNVTVALLPDDWNCLHLCPGFLWGRRFRDKSKIGHLNPEISLERLEYHDSGRFFHNCDNATYYSVKGWLGGPEAFIIRKHNIDRFMILYIMFCH